MEIPLTLIGPATAAKPEEQRFPCTRSSTWDRDDRGTGTSLLRTWHIGEIKWHCYVQVSSLWCNL